MRIGYCAMSADIIHAGHILHLKRCKDLCDVLIVGLMTDKVIEDYKARPIMCFEDRKVILESIKYVNSVIPQNTFDMYGNTCIVNPDILFDSKEHNRVGDYSYMKAKGKEVVILPRIEGYSSSDIKEYICKRYS